MIQACCRRSRVLREAWDAMADSPLPLLLCTHRDRALLFSPHTAAPCDCDAYTRTRRFIGEKAGDENSEASESRKRKDLPVDSFDLIGAAPSWLLRQPDAASREPSPVRDPFDSAGLWSQDILPQRPRQSAVAEAVWPQGQSTKALRWA